MLSFLVVRPNVQNLLPFISVYSSLLRIFSLDTSRITSYHHHLLTQSCLTLCKPMDCSPPGPSVHGIFQTRILEWVVISSSRGIFPMQGSNTHLLYLLHWQVDFLPLSHLGSLLSIKLYVPMHKSRCVYVNESEYTFVSSCFQCSFPQFSFYKPTSRLYNLRLTAYNASN